MDVAIFGTGLFYKNRKSKLNLENDKVAFFLDNRVTEFDAFEDKIVYHPSFIKKLTFDIILLMSSDSSSMRRQLLRLGVNANQIWDWEHYAGERGHGKLCVHLPADVARLQSTSRRVLIVTTHMNYNGGSLAAVYAAMALQAKGFDVSLAAPSIEEGFLAEVLGQGIRIIVMPSAIYWGREESDWLRLYDAVLVNVFQMVRAAITIGKYRHVAWWIHESSEAYGKYYSETRRRFPAETECVPESRTYIMAVSNIAQHSFETYYPGRVDTLMFYGIPDEAADTDSCTVEGKERFVFAVIGSVIERKGQSIFLQAVSLLPQALLRRAEFWLVGGVGTDEYSFGIRQEAGKFANVRMVGQLSREGMRQIFPDIDVVVCPSLEDPLPIVITEGWMHGKICIMSGATGQADMTEDGVNGLVCKAGDAQDLADKMAWVLQNQDKLDGIRRKGRETYEKYFSMESFGERLEQALLAAECKFNEQRN